MTLINNKVRELSKLSQASELVMRCGYGVKLVPNLIEIGMYCARVVNIFIDHVPHCVLYEQMKN